MSDKEMCRGDTMLVSVSADGDTIYKQAAIAAIKKLCDECDSSWCGDCRIKYPGKDAESVLKNLPSARPGVIHCKDCKYWKDSDGVYRRGPDAESKCPLNIKEVYEGTFFCGMAKRRV